VSRDPTLPPGPLAPASDDLDPLSKLGRIAGPNTTSPPSAAWTHSPSVSDHFRPPSPIVQQRQAPSPAPVDEDWNQTVYDREQLQPEPVPVPPVVERVPPPQPPPPQKTAQPAPTPVSPAPARVPRPAAEPSTRTGLPRDSLASRPDGRPSGLDLEAALRQLGIEPADLARETVDELAKVAQSVLQGLIDVLRARAQLRNQLRLPAVRVQSTRNNPFDFAINAQDALGSLIDHANPGYLPAAEAFADTFGDMRRHELATLAGIRAGFQSMLRLFEPQAMQDRFDRQLKHAGFLPLGAKLRYWELYSDLYEQLQGDPDGTFQRMFGQAFADAYARQLDALRSVPDGNR
jgi:type VI secretion system FHA domain protein